MLDLDALWTGSILADGNFGGLWFKLILARMRLNFLSVHVSFTCGCGFKKSAIEFKRFGFL